MKNIMSVVGANLNRVLTQGNDISLIMLVWGLWNLFPTNVYALSPAFSPLTRLGPIWLWGVIMTVLGTLPVIGVYVPPNRATRPIKLTVGVLQGIVWGLFMGTLFTSTPVPPGAPIIILYLLVTAWSLYRKLEKPVVLQVKLNPKEEKFYLHRVAVDAKQTQERIEVQNMPIDISSVTPPIVQGVPPSLPSPYIPGGVSDQGNIVPKGIGPVAIVAVASMFIMTVVLVITLTIFTPGRDNTTLITAILAGMVPLTGGILALLKQGQDTHVALNSRLSQLVAASTGQATAEAMLEAANRAVAVAMDNAVKQQALVAANTAATAHATEMATQAALMASNATALAVAQTQAGTVPATVLAQVLAAPVEGTITGSVGPEGEIDAHLSGEVKGPVPDPGTGGLK